MKIKVCGMKDPANVKVIAGLEPDYMGFIFYEGSTRYIGSEFSPAILNEIEKGTHTVGVFVNPDQNELRTLLDLYALDIVQLHGNESVDLCKRVQDLGVKVIKAFGVKDSTPNEIIERYQECVDFFLFDTKTVTYGGSGRKFNWQVLDQYDGDVPFFLSGGIGPGDIHEVLNYSHSKLYAIDLNSQFELSPGYKDQDMLSDFLDTIRHEVSSR